MLAVRFVVDERLYLYHFFGQLMDAAVWAAATMDRCGARSGPTAPITARAPRPAGRRSSAASSRQPSWPPTSSHGTSPGCCGMCGPRRRGCSSQHTSGASAVLRQRRPTERWLLVKSFPPLSVGDEVSPDLALSISHTAPRRSVSTSRDCCPSQVAGETPDHAHGSHWAEIHRLAVKGTPPSSAQTSSAASLAGTPPSSSCRSVPIFR